MGNLQEKSTEREEKMKSIIKCIVAAALMYASSTTAAVLPLVGKGTEPNQWTSNISGVLAAAKTTNLPIFLVMINDSSTGEGCAHCLQFVKNSLNSQEFANIVAGYRFYMVLLNKWTPTEVNYGGVSAEVWQTYFSKYRAGDSGYPQVSVIKPDGTRYTGWSHYTQPVSTRGTMVLEYIRSAISELAPTTDGYVPPAAATNTVTEPEMPSGTAVSAGEAPAGNFALFFFDGSDNIVASAQLKVTKASKWNAKIQDGGSTKRLVGSVIKLPSGSLSTGSPDLNLMYDSSAGIWYGTSSGRRVYGKAVDKADATWKGSWNIGFYSSTSPTQGGWATAKVGPTGKVTFSGKISNSTKILGSCTSAIFPAAFVSAYVPRWAGRGDVRFAHGSTRAGVNVGCALFANGTLGGNVSLDSQTFDAVGGSLWQRGLIAGLEGKTFSTVGGGYVSFPVTATSGNIAAGANDYNARLRCTASRGQVTATYKVSGKTYKATGVIYNTGYAPIAIGGGKQRSEKFGFVIQ